MFNIDLQCFSNQELSYYEQFYPNNLINNGENSYKQKTEIDNLKTRATLNIIQESSFNDDNKNNSEKLKLGRKRKNSKSKGLHNKYSGDNIIRKIKSTLLSDLINYINSLIYKSYNGQINQGILKKELKKMDQSQIKNVKENKEFLYKKLKDIFSFDISGRYTNFLYGHNKNLINELLNEKDEEKRMKFENIFNLTFLDCLNHFSGKKYFKDIEGLKSLDEESKKYEDDLDYYELFRKYVNDFEDIIMRKKSRNRKTTENK